MFGNRGCLHDSAYNVRREFATTAWLSCRLRVNRTRAVQRDDNRAFNGRKRVLQSPGHYTELFFADEYTALAAGHRPCACCRRSDYMDFLGAWKRAHGGTWTAATIDRTLHAERRCPSGAKRRHSIDSIWTLPQGAMVVREEQGGHNDGDAWLLWQGALLRWSHHGYTERATREEVDACAQAGVAYRLLTPPSLVALLEEGGWRPGPPHVSAMRASDTGSPHDP